MSELKTADISICREDDGDMNLEIFIDHDNQISLSINKDGSIAWAGASYGSRDHKRTDAGNMGKILFQLISQSAE